MIKSWKVIHRRTHYLKIKNNKNNINRRINSGTTTTAKTRNKHIYIVFLTPPEAPYTGLLIFRGKKAKFRGIFRGKFAEKSADFAGFSREKNQNSRNNRPISGDFRGRKVKIRRKIGPFRGILAEKSQFSKDFQGQILRKIGRFHGKFRGETSPRNNQ